MPETCVCGGSRSQPNPDCERCDLIAEVDRLRARVTDLERERDRLIERWPEGLHGRVFRSICPEDAGWEVDDNSVAVHPTKEAAVRAATGLDVKGDDR